MKGADRLQQGRSSLELIEEAVHLLRTAPAGTLAYYYVGALPFVLGALYFWADMSRSADAYQHLETASLSLALLFLWMKFWQARFGQSLRARMTSHSPGPGSFRRSWRLFLTQTALQPTGLFALPLAFLLLAPFGWVYAFYQNLAMLAEDDRAELRTIVKAASRQAALWPRQNHVLLLVLVGFGGCVFLNWSIVCYLLPGLAKTLFGLDSAFSRSGLSLLNSTFFAVMFGLTYLCVDPILKASYALRCFYGQSLQSGEDLKAELRPFSAAQKVAAGVAWLLLVTSVGLAAAASPSVENAGQFSDAPPGPQTSTERSGGNSHLSSSRLDQTIQQVLQQRKYTWRMPREKRVGPEEAEKGLIGRFLEKLGMLARKWLKAFGEWLEEWLRKLFQRQQTQPQSSSSGYGWILSQQLLLYLLVLAVLAGLGLLLYRVWRERQRQVEPLTTQALRLAPDLRDESVGADQLPEEGWMQLARELMEQGELRLALRAFYLASLAHLAQRNLIRLAKFKSNRDYEQELQRRALSFPDLLTLFAENVAVFERTWYGLHVLSPEVLGHFAANVERLKAGGGEPRP